MTSEGFELALRSGRLHAERRGPPGGALALCVPGLSANLRSFDAIAGSLAQEPGRRAVALDLRGRGLSAITAEGTYGWRSHAADVLESATALGAEQFDLIGHSMGAFVSMQAAALSPSRVRRLVIIDGAGVPEPAVIPPILAAVQRLEQTYPSADAYLAGVRERGTAVPWEFWEGHYRYDLLPDGAGVRPRTSKAAVLEDAVYGSRQDASQLWKELSMPVLLLRASLPFVPGDAAGSVVGVALRDAFLDAVPSGRSVEVPANHYGIMAHERSLAAIAAFLRGAPLPD